MYSTLHSKVTTSTVRDTVDALKAELERRSVRLFAQIDHAEAARGVGLEMRDTQVLLFGNPEIGTILMQQHGAIALALPLKVVIYASAAGTHVAFQPLVAQAPAFGMNPETPLVKKMDAFMHGLIDAVITQ